MPALGGVNSTTSVATSAELTAHTDDATAAHAASAIAFTPAGTVAATTVQAAIEEVAAEGSGIPQGGPLTEDLLTDGNGIKGADDGTSTGARLDLNNGADGGQAMLAGGNQGAGLAGRPAVFIGGTGDAGADAGASITAQGGSGVGDPGVLVVNGTRITNLADPTDPQDAATKAYVDENGGVYVQDADPGAVGAGKLWVDTTTDTPVIYRRNAADDAWLDVFEFYQGLGAIELIANNAALRLKRVDNGDPQVIRTELFMEEGDLRLFARAATGDATNTEWEVSTDGMGATLTDDAAVARVIHDASAGENAEADARWEWIVKDAASADKARFRLDETGIEIEGDLNLTLTNAPEVPATPDAQDIVDALIALGLVTQAAP